jgi:hypothetical protein
VDQKRWLEDDAESQLDLPRCGDRPCLTIFAMNRAFFECAGPGSAIPNRVLTLG